MADVALHHDVDALHRDPATRGRVTLDDKKTTTAGRASVLAGVALDGHLARHHILGNAGTGRAVHGDRRLLVHARAIVANAALHIEVDGGVDADGHCMSAARIQNFPIVFVGTVFLAVKSFIELT